MCGEEYLCDKFDFKKRFVSPLRQTESRLIFLHRRKDDIPEAVTTFS